ncbi:MAG: DUF309 domain-containing protein [Alphaproteobacteria bacterium]|nr:DUF309 domain-containing protein [Alphaproteobacteria bacterium]
MRPPRRSARPLPPYAFVPGRSPHPFRHPDGHAWQGGDAPRAAAWQAGDPAADDAWRWGVELFEQGFPWEAHEAWEGIWRQVPPSDPLRALLQGLIQVAGAEVKRLQGDPRGEARLRSRGLARVREVAAVTPVCHGLHLEASLALLEAGTCRLVLEEP